MGILLAGLTQRKGEGRREQGAGSREKKGEEGRREKGEGRREKGEGSLRAFDVVSLFVAEFF
eukprot:SAG31_NODE_1336_length_8738_cov_4.855655_7_plen_62_part_00